MGGTGRARQLRIVRNRAARNGLYPHWWEGWRIDRPPRCYIAGKTTETMRDIVQTALFGPISAFGTGMIPKRLLGEAKAGQTLAARLTGLTSSTRQAAHGASSTLRHTNKVVTHSRAPKRLIWGDEEMPADIYSECLTRTGTTDGRIILTFTPPDGVTEVVNSFLEKAVHV